MICVEPALLLHGGLGSRRERRRSSGSVRGSLVVAPGPSRPAGTRDCSSSSSIKAVPPALEAGLSTTGPPGKAQRAAVLQQTAFTPFLPLLRPLQPGSLPSHRPRPPFQKVTDHFCLSASTGHL